MNRLLKRLKDFIITTDNKTLKFKEKFKEFNPFEKWPYCKKNMEILLDQGRCGICGVCF